MDKLLGRPVVGVDSAGEQSSVTVGYKAGPFKMIFGTPLTPPITRENEVQNKLALDPFIIATSFFFDKSGQLYCKPIFGATRRSEVFIWPGGIVKASGCARVVFDPGGSHLSVILPNETVKAEFGLMVEQFFPCPTSRGYLSYCRYQKVDEVMDWTGCPYLLPEVTDE